MSKTITRKYIQRITKREGNTSIRQSGGGGGGGGGASQYWVEENYISKLFFNQLFTVYDEDGNVVEPNDTESVIASIKSMFGFWTDAYLSALGNGEGGGAELTLDSLADVDVHGVANGQALVYDATTQKWVPGQGGGIDITAMWAALAQSGVQQIDVSHLATALTGYATETWVGNQGYITGSALNGYATESWVGSQISDMATQTWVSGNYLSQMNAAATYLTQTNAAATYLTKSDAATTYVSIAFFERLFKAYNGSTVVHPNNTTSTIDNIKAMFGFWTDFYLSALGNGSGGSTPGVTMAQVWSALGNSTTEQINISHLTTALSGYNPTSNFKTINGNSIIGTGDIVISGGGGGTVTSIKVGTTSYSPTDGVVSLPAYPSTLDDIADGSTRKLANYLPLTGGSVSGLLQANVANNYSTSIIKDVSSFSAGQSSGDSIWFGFYPYYYGWIQSSYCGRSGVSSSEYTYPLILQPIGGNVGIGTNAPSYKLHVNGGVCATSFVMSGGTSSQFLKADGSTDSNTYATTSALGNYLPLSGGTLTGTLSMENANKGVQIDFRPDNPTYSSRISMKCYGQDAIVWANTAAVTSFLFYTGLALDNSTANWTTYGTPAMQIKNNCVYINEFINNNVSPSYTLRVNGVASVKSINIGVSNDQINTTDGAGLHLQYNTGSNVSLCAGSSKGSVGICTTSPSYKLHVAGTFYASGNSSIGGTLGVSGELTLSDKLILPQSGGIYSLPTSSKVRKIYGCDSSDGAYTRMISYAMLPDNDSDDAWQVRPRDGDYTNAFIHVKSSGDVGIGTTSPSYKLDVSGSFASSTAYISEFLKVETGDTHSLSDNMQTSASVCIGEYDDDAIWIGRVKTGSVGFIQCSYKSANAAKYTLSLQPLGGNVGIGTVSPSYKLHVAGTFYASGNSSIGGTFGVTGATTLSSTLVVSGNAKFSGYTGFGYDADTNYRVKVKGVAYASTGVYSGGYVTALSDIRHKDVQGNVRLTVREIANAPSVKFLWKDRRQEGLQVGSIAQYWKKVMPEAIVENADGELTMSYGVIALLASIATARKVEDHERRIRELEEENKKLKQQLNAA